MSDLYQGYQGRDMQPHNVPDNATPYQQGRSDQKHFDRVVAVVLLIVLGVYITWGK